MPWFNSIERISEEDPSTLIPSDGNARIHGGEQQAFVTASLQEFGWIDDVIASSRTKKILNGHLRVSLAVKRKEKTVPVKWVNVDEDQERLILAGFDALEAMAQQDRERGIELLKLASPKNGVLEAFFQSDLERLQKEANSIRKVQESQVERSGGDESVSVSFGGYLKFELKKDVFDAWLSGLLAKFPEVSKLYQELQRRLSF